MATRKPPPKKTRIPAHRASGAKAGQGNKTVATGASVAAFLAGVKDPVRAADVRTLMAIMRRVSGKSPRMWGPSIVGFGSYHYVYDSGREGDMLRLGFSPRASALTLYIMGGFPRYATLMRRLGRYTTGNSCLYLKRLADVDLSVLEELIRASWAFMAVRYPDPRAR